MRSWYRTLAAGVLACALASALPIAARADGPPPHDLLNATLWMQRSVEYKAQCARRLCAGQDPARPGARRQELDRRRRPSRRATIRTCRRRVDARRRRDAARQFALPGLDGAERHRRFSRKTWTEFVQRADSRAIPGARRVHQIRRLQGREGVLHLEPHRRGEGRRRARTWSGSASRWAATSTPS